MKFCSQLMYILPTHSLVLRRSFSLCCTALSGHNKWSKIKDKKGANDQNKSVIYGKANREIMLAVRLGGSPDPNLNLQLAGVIKKAKDQGVPKENIASALAKARGKGKNGEHFTYEALAFGSVGVMIECLTDNATRTVNNIREILTEHGGHLAPVKFMFQRKGMVKVALPTAEGIDASSISENLIDAALGGGAEDFEDVSEEGEAPAFQFICPPEDLATLTSELTSYCANSSAELQASELIYSPAEVSEPAEDIERQVIELVEDLEGNEDTLRVWTSLD